MPLYRRQIQLRRIVEVVIGTEGFCNASLALRPALQNGLAEFAQNRIISRCMLELMQSLCRECKC